MPNQDDVERGYVDGRRAAFRRLLMMCLSELGESLDDTERQLIITRDERTDAVVALREVCEEFGDNDWLDNLHLADVIEKHLHRPLASSQ